MGRAFHFLTTDLTKPFSGFWTDTHFTFFTSSSTWSWNWNRRKQVEMSDIGRRMIDVFHLTITMINLKCEDCVVAVFSVVCLLFDPTTWGKGYHEWFFLRHLVHKSGCPTLMCVDQNIELGNLTNSEIVHNCVMFVFRLDRFLLLIWKCS